MPRFICKFTHPQSMIDMYFDWSTVVDAPVTAPLTRQEYIDSNAAEYNCVDELMVRLDRADKKGTSSMIDDSFDSVIQGNRAGEKESHLSKDKLIAYLMKERESMQKYGHYLKAKKQ